MQAEEGIPSSRIIDVMECSNQIHSGRRLGSRGRWSRGVLWLAVFFTLIALVCGDFYRVLGISRSADMDDIKRAHRDLVKKNHPDKSKSASTHDKFLKVQRAYEVLSDPEKRKLYDQYGKDPDDPEVLQAVQNDARQRFRSYDPMDTFFHRSRKQQYFVPSKTQTLTLDNYDALVTQGEQIWMIQVWREFNCEKCIQVSDAWEEAARQMAGVVNFGRINFDRQGALLHRYRIQKLPTFYAITGRREVKFMENHRAVTTESIVDFASKCVPDGSLTYLKSAAAADRFLRSESDKVHVILFIEEWAAFASVAEIPSFKEAMVFAFAPRWAPHGLGDLYGKFKERTIVVVKDDRKFVAKSGIQSRKNLVRFLLKNKHMKVPKMTVHNYAELCLGWGGPSEGLHFIPPDRNSSTVCVLSLRRGSKPSERPEVDVMLKVPEGSWPKAQFGWVDATDQTLLWEYLSKKLPKNHEREKDQDFILAAIDWVEGVTNIFESDTRVEFKQSVEIWLETLSKSDEWLTEKDAGQVPGLQLQSSRFDKLERSLLSYLGPYASLFESMGWTRTMLMCVALYWGFKWLSKALHEIGRGQQERPPQGRSTSDQEELEQQQQRRRQQEQARQQQAREQAQQDEARREARQEQSNGSRGGAAHTNGDGMRHRSTASGAKGAAGGKPSGAAGGDPSESVKTERSDLESRLQRSSGRELREYAEKHRINIVDCSEKSEIVSRIMGAMR